MPPSAEASRIPRWVLAERLAHWLYALFFVIGLVSGLLMWIPATRAWLGGAREGVALRHGFTGYAMVFIPLILMLVVNRRRLASDVREVDLWDVDDRRWFWASVKGRGLRGGEMPPQGKLNAGQKVSVVLVAAMALGFVVTGTLLLTKAGLPAWLVSRALWLHGFLAIAATAVFLGHLGHVFLTRHGRGYLSSMVRGGLPEHIARERHRTWWEEQRGESLVRADGGSPVEGGSPADVEFSAEVASSAERGSSTEGGSPAEGTSPSDGAPPVTP
jgi:formate dehydrogenase subunit gamma